MSGLLVEDVLPLPDRAARAGLVCVAEACWPEPADAEPPKVAGFIHSSFNPLVVAVAARCLQRRPAPAPGTVTAVILVSALGDVASATHVAAAVDGGTRVGPLFFFQSVPNAVAGHVAARWNLTGPVVCVAAVADGLAVAGLLLADADADAALIVRVGTDDADAVVVTAEEG
jgi:hypothetical protein